MILEKLKVGDRIRVMGAVLNTGREGKLELTLRKDSPYCIMASLQIRICN